MVSYGSNLLMDYMGHKKMIQLVVEIWPLGDLQYFLYLNSIFDNQRHHFLYLDSIVGDQRHLVIIV